MLGSVTLLALCAVSVATPFLAYDYWRRWFALPGVLLTAQVPVLVVITAVIVCFVATLYPSRQAARLDPAQALRYE